MSIPFNELLAKVQAGGEAGAWGKLHAELERRLYAFASADGLDKVMSLTEQHWEFIEYSLTGDNAHTEWTALNKLRNALSILDGIEPKKEGKK